MCGVYCLVTYKHVEILKVHLTPNPKHRSFRLLFHRDMNDIGIICVPHQAEVSSVY